MTNLHPQSFACAIVSRKKPNLAARIFSGNRTAHLKSSISNHLTGFGLTIAGDNDGSFTMFADFEEEAQLTIVPINDKIELWLGWPVAYMAEDMLGMAEPATDIPPSNLDALFIVQDKRAQRYLHQYVRDGKFGEGLLSCDYSKRMWMRSFRQEHWPAPKSSYLEEALRQFLIEICEDEDLVMRVYSGMYGKGRYGMAYHPDKKVWVMARSLPNQSSDPPSANANMFQELNPNSYAKKGKPFERAEDPRSGLAFLRQSDLIYEIQQRAFSSSVGFRFDQSLSDQPLFQGIFQKFWVERA